MPQKKAQKLLLIIDSCLQDTVLAAMAVRSICELVSLSPEEINRVELCLVEVVNNAIIHGYGSESGHAVEIEVRLLPEEALEIVVSDYGLGLSQDGDGEVDSDLLAPDPDAPESLMVSGRGLAIVGRLMNSISYHSSAGRNSFHMVKKLSKA